MPQRLFEPVTLPRSGLTLENRLVMAPMPTFASLPDGRISPAEVAYLERRARGGLAAIVTAGCSVSAEGQCVAGQWRCDYDGLIDSLAQAARAIQSGSAWGGGPVRAVLQLCHGGSIALGDRALGPPQMTDRDTRALCRDFGQAARRGRQAGFDAVEIHGGHGYLPQQFFSRRTNRRRWAWGGESVMERARFPLALAAAVGSACGGDFSCWYRLTPEEPGPDGIAVEDTLRLAEALAGSGAEVIDVAAREFQAGSTRNPQDPVPPAVRIQQATGERACVMAAGRLRQPEQALQVVAAGIPLVGLGRILLSEPDWARKVAEQSPEPLRGSLPGNATLNDLALPRPMLDYLRRKQDAEWRSDRNG